MRASGSSPDQIRPPNPWTPSVKVILGVTIAHLVIAGIWAVAQRRYEFLVYLAFTPVLLLLLGRLHARIRFSPSLLWCLSILAFVHMAGGLVRIPADWPVEGRHRLYDWWLIPRVLKYDHLVHTFGNAVATWLCWQVLQRTVASKTGWGFHALRPTWELLFFCVLSGMGIGSVNEIAEFVTTKFVRDHGVGGYANTLMDLVANSVGSLVVAWLIWLHGKRTCEPGTSVVCEVRNADA